MLITSKEAVWRKYIVSRDEWSVPTFAEDTPDWVKEAHFLFTHKQYDKFFDLLEAHGIIEPEAEEA